MLFRALRWGYRGYSENNVSPKEVLEFARKTGVKQLDLRFSDIPVAQHHISCPITELTEESFQDGFGVDGSRIQPWAPVEEIDRLLIPDPDTAFVDPYFEVATLVMICDVIDPITRQNHHRDPRSIAKKAELYLKNAGAGDAAHFSAEAEFTVFEGVRFDQDQRAGFHFVDPLRTRMVETRLEIDRRHDTLVKSADNMILYKYVVRNGACRRGKTVTFMPKPLFGERGNGMPTRQSVWKGGEPLFAGDGYGGLGPMGLHYIGGLLKHARALSAIVAPTTNSYKRLVADGEAPVHLAYSRRFGSAACRIPLPGGIEFRPPDPSSNPYLAFSAMLMAGLDGVLNQIDPGEPLEEMTNIPTMPSSLEEALDCLDEDHDFLIKSDVFSEDLLETFIEYKRRIESDAVRVRPHPYEFELYYDV